MWTNWSSRQFLLSRAFVELQWQISCNAKTIVITMYEGVFALKRKFCNMTLNFTTLLSLFDTYVGSIAYYGCEVWGFHSAPDIEKIHLNYCKNILNVKRWTSNSVIYCELGRMPLQCIRKIRIVRYWMELLSSKNGLLNSCYVNMYNESLCKIKCYNWAAEIKNMLSSIGLMNL